MRKRFLLFMVTALLGAGCSGVDLKGEVLKGVAGPLTQGVFGLATEDAKTTLTWVDAQVAAGGLSPTDAALAKACPTAVLEVAALREKMLNPPPAPVGFKGILFNATVLRFGSRNAAPEVKRAALAVFAACADLAPDQLILGF